MLFHFNEFPEHKWFDIRICNRRPTKRNLQISSCRLRFLNEKMASNNKPLKTNDNVIKILSIDWLIELFEDVSIGTNKNKKLTIRAPNKYKV